MNSFDFQAIFLPRPGQDLSKNVGPVSVYAFLKKLYCRIGSDMIAKNGRNFRKSDVCEAQIEFQRPCRGLSPGKGFASKAGEKKIRKKELLFSRFKLQALMKLSGRPQSDELFRKALSME